MTVFGVMGRDSSTASTRASFYREPSMLLWASLVWVLCHLWAQAHAGGRWRTMHTQSPIQTDRAPSEGPLAGLSREPHAHHSCDHFALHFRSAADLHRIGAVLSERLLHPPDYIPHNTFRVYACEATLRDLDRDLPGLLWLGRVRPEDKCHTALWQQRHGPANSGNASAVTLTVLTAPVPELQAIWARTPKLRGARFRCVHARKWLVEVAPEALSTVLPALVHQPEVGWVERRPTFVPQNHKACSLLQSPTLGPHPLWDRGLDGSGQLAHIGDTGLDYDSCFFRDDAQPVAFYPKSNPKHRKMLSYQEMVEDDGTRSPLPLALCGSTPVDLAALVPGTGPLGSEPQADSSQWYTVCGTKIVPPPPPPAMSNECLVQRTLPFGS